VKTIIQSKEACSHLKIQSLVPELAFEPTLLHAMTFSPVYPIRWQLSTLERWLSGCEQSPVDLLDVALRLGRDRAVRSLSGLAFETVT
jgi:hypothetical protein